MNLSEPNPQWMVEPLTLASIPLATEAASSPASKQPFKRLAWLSLAALLGLGAWGTALHFLDPNAAPPQASDAADTRNEVPAIALRGVRWLALQSPEFFVLEHGAFRTAAQAQSLIQTRNELANARVLMRKSASPVGQFVVITGPFRSQERAQNYKVRENLPPQIQVRRVSDVLAESVRTAP